jgi:DNA polymerase-3 subunit gamma/tau
VNKRELKRTRKLCILAEKADGSMRDALTFFDQAYAFTGNDMSAEAVHSVLGIPPNELFFSLLESIANHDLKGCFDVVDKACSIGVEFAPLLDGFAKFIRNRLYIRVGGITAEELNISDALYGKLQSCAANLSNGDLLRVAKILTDLQGSLRHSTNPRLLVESSFARMAWLDHLTDLRKALAAINDPDSAAEQSKKKVTEAASPQTMAPPAPIRENGTAEVSDSSFTVNFDVTDGSTANNDFTIEFGNPDSNTFETGPIYTRYDVCNAWPEIIRESFSQEVGFFAASLSGSVLEHGDYQANPFPLKVVYRAGLAWGYEQITSRKDYQDRLMNLLEDMLQTKISLQYLLLSPQPWRKNHG